MADKMFTLYIRMASSFLMMPLGIILLIRSWNYAHSGMLKVFAVVLVLYGAYRFRQHILFYRGSRR